ncbi:MAG: Stp1/IreP family PP2C-type Ser/Thr phosphatase [Clostridia bacterium]|nr:Stp1/IreP family PP2C-type Ser/Thr phosphatase [Clostridia bacterium]
MMGTKHRVNQDSFYVKQEGKKSLCIVADGMGGHNAGDVASKNAIEILSKIKKFDEKTIKSAITEANNSIFDMSKCDKSLEGMGTTVVMALVKGENATIVNVGDSRAYGINRMVAKQITIDHSYVQELISDGKITLAEANKHPLKNIITKAVGVAESVEPNICEVTMGKDEIILLCSDGVSGAVSEEEMIACCYEYIPPQAAEMLCRLAVKNGATDDVTAIVIRID